jgi:hypothetical protein
MNRLRLLTFPCVALTLSFFSNIPVVIAESKTGSPVAFAELGPTVAESFKLADDAKFTSNSLQLTEARNSLQGIGLLKAPQTLSAARSFSSHFSMQMTDPVCHTGLGADGLSFVMQGSLNTKRAIGWGLGYAGTEMSIAVEFDTYTNREFEDPNAQHIGLSLHGDPSSYATVQSPYTLNDGQVYYVWIEYDGAAKFLEVRISDNTTRPEVALMRTQVDLTGVLDNKVFVGFSAATGSCNEQHDIKSFYFQNSFLKDGIKVSPKSK